jgi:hypothetical protein
MDLGLLRFHSAAEKEITSGYCLGIKKFCLPFVCRITLRKVKISFLCTIKFAIVTIFCHKWKRF